MPDSPRTPTPTGTGAHEPNATRDACLYCGEPIEWSDHWQEWFTAAKRSAEHYVNVCAGNR